MATSSVSVAIVGCGRVAHFHAEAFRSLGTRVAWTVDTSPERREAMARELNACPTARLEEVLSDPEVSAIDICLPHHLHAPIAIQALRSGRHVLCEKPLANSLNEADDMIEAAERVGRVLMVAENVRFDPALRRIRELLDAGAVGTVSLVQITRDVWFPEPELVEHSWFRQTETAGGGIMMSGGVHDFEKARMLFGEISHICAVRAPQRLHGMEGDDTSLAMVRFNSGAVGTIIESYSAMTPETRFGQEVHALRVDGSLGSITHADGGNVVLLSSPDRLPGSATVQTIEVAEVDTFKAEISHFLDAIAEGYEPITSGRSQRRALELVLTAYQSMDKGGMKLIELPTST